MKTSHKKNRPFDFKLIDLVEPQPILYQRQTGLSSFAALKAKNAVWEEIASKMGVSTKFCVARWSNLRGQYQKELRHCRELCPKEGIIRGSNWPYLQRLSFLKSTIQFNKPKCKPLKTPSQKKLNSNRDGKQVVELSIPLAAEHVETIDAIESDVRQVGETIDDVHHMNEVNTNDEFIMLVGETTTSGNGDDDDISEFDATENSLRNLQKISALLAGIDDENLIRIERRITAFLCKCQLRALNNRSMDDLDI